MRCDVRLKVVNPHLWRAGERRGRRARVGEQDVNGRFALKERRPGGHGPRRWPFAAKFGPEVVGSMLHLGPRQGRRERVARRRSGRGRSSAARSVGAATAAVFWGAATRDRLLEVAQGIKIRCAEGTGAARRAWFGGKFSAR